MFDLVLSHLACFVYSGTPLQVAPYERPALSKGYLLPEGIHSLVICESAISEIP